MTIGNNMISSAKKSSMLFRPVGDMKAWELYVSHALLMFVAGMVFAALSKIIPAVFGEDNPVTKFATTQLQLVKAATVTGNYKDAPVEYQIA